MTEFVTNIYNGVIDGDAVGVKNAVESALQSGSIAEDLLNHGLIAAMKEVGRLFEEGEYFVPEILISARAMQAGMGILRPILVAQDIKPKGKVVIGTVQGDLHDIGKNLVSMMLEGAAFEIVDLGSDVPPQKFVDAVRENDADFVAMSALLTTTMPNMKTTIEALEESGLRSKVKVLIGGAPVTSQYAHEIGADGFAPDASRAVALAKSLAAS